jgi:hypothetical protein
MEGLSATVVYLGMGSGLAIGVALLIVAILFLRTARRYVELAEERLELLRERETAMPRVARQQGHASRERRPEPKRSEKIPEMVGRAVGQRRADETPGDPPPPETSDRSARDATLGMREQVSSSEDGERRREGAPTAGTPGAAASRPKDGAPLRGVKVPHPDDDVTQRDRNSLAANFFQKKYDLYLEQYERFVRLAERIHRMRNEAAESPGSLQAREWEDKLGRTYDAIGRTTQRLDLLEHHYPELATDSDRLSHRLELARLQAELAERRLRD